MIYKIRASKRRLELIKFCLFRLPKVSRQFSTDWLSATSGFMKKNIQIYLTTFLITKTLG